MNFLTASRLRAVPLVLLAALAACNGDGLAAPDRATPSGVAFAPGHPTVLTSLGDSLSLSPTVRDASGSSIPGAALNWSVSPAGIVERDGEGVYRAIANGRVTIIAAVELAATGVHPDGYWAGRLADTAVVDVQQRPALLTLDAIDTAFSTVGASRLLRAHVTDARGNALLNGPPAFVWQSTDSTIVSVDGGIVHSRGDGSARISVRAADLTRELAFSVHAQLPHTSCMVFSQRRQTQKTCVTLELTLRERGGGQ